MSRYGLLPLWLAAYVLLAGCASTASSTDIVGALKEIASDPRCGHTDRVSGNLGGFGGNNLNVFLERTCPVAPPEPAVTAGDLFR